MPERPSKTDQNRPAAIAQSGHFNNPGGSILDAQGGSILGLSRNLGTKLPGLIISQFSF
jgi:hypothetical protein